MPLSTSNSKGKSPLNPPLTKGGEGGFSDERRSAGKWGRTWLAVLIALTVILGSWEGFWRLQGIRPTLIDDWGIWAMVRREASRKGEPAIALAGSSRIQVGLHPDVLKRWTGLQPLVLAIDGSSPLPVLHDLSQDNEFRGHVICSLIPMFLAEPPEDGQAEKWVRKYHEQKWSSLVETRLSIFVQQAFAFRYSGLAPDKLWTNFKKGTWPLRPYAPMRPDRYRPADFSSADVQKIRDDRIERELEIHASATPLAEKDFLDRVKRIGRMVKRIEARGGRVAFVRFPSSGVVRKLERQTWPRARYWDVFAKQVQAVAIHFEDYPELAGFKTPDGSHLDVEDAKRFTRALIKVLEDAGYKPWK